MDVPEDIRAAARTTPNHLLGVLDPAWRGDGTPPVWAVRGQWRTDADGAIAGWLPNPEYLPSPVARGWPEPTDPVDDALQRAATGYGEAEELLAALATATVSVPVGGDGKPVTVRTPDGGTAVPVFTADDHRVRAGSPAGRTVPVVGLVLGLEHDLLINPGGVVTMVVSSEELRHLTGS